MAFLFMFTLQCHFSLLLFFDAEPVANKSPWPAASYVTVDPTRFPHAKGIPQKNDTTENELRKLLLTCFFAAPKEKC
jgi:hypothetical protein